MDSDIFSAVVEIYSAVKKLILYLIIVCLGLSVP